jgi:DNA/RNA endonuclease G (NUC1)
MRTRNSYRWLAAAGTLLLSTIATAQVRISEFHYDNTGADADERVEVSAPAGTDLTGWRVILYNGSGGASYATLNLSGTVAATCDARGVVVVAAVGMQNGAPDGLALVAPGDAVVEFLSYEGVFTAVGGPANGLMSVDVGVIEAGTEPLGMSLARDAAGIWSGPAAHTFGACNDNGDTQPPAEVASVTVAPASATISIGGTFSFNAAAFDISNAPINNVPFTWVSSNTAVATVSNTGVVTGVAEGDATISATATNGVGGSSAIHVVPVTQPPAGEFHINEIHYDNASTDTGEAIEIEGPAGASIEGFSIVLVNGGNSAPYGTPVVLHGTLPATCDTRGVVVVDYPQDGIQNGSPDAIALLDASGQVLEFLSYEGVITGQAPPVLGLTSIDIGVSQSNAALGTSLQRGPTGVWASGLSSFGACNAAAPPPLKSILITGRDPNDDVPLPVGYEDQLFGQLRENGVNVPSTFTWVAETPDIATIEPNGVFRALAVGSARFRATAADGTTTTITLPTRIAVAGTTAVYGNNTEFGDPVDGTPADDIIVRRAQYTGSYSPVRNSPNWVAYEFDATHFGAEDRCDCFTMDPELPASLPRITTDDYTGSGAIAGYGIDRGHLARSFDRTTGSLDNATTFLFSNIIPQASDQNQGPWAQLENELGNFARNDNREVYVIAGVAGNKGTLKNLGLVTIPTHTWKVALILPRDTGLAQIRDYRDVQVIAVIMPNDPGIRNTPWQTFVDTIDSVETLSGYDLLAALPDAIEAAVESNTQPPILSVAGPAAINEGGSATFSAAGSLDPNGTIVSYSWSFGDGATGEGASPSHTYLQDGVYDVTLTATDNDGLVTTATVPIVVDNVVPAFGGFPDATRATGETYSLASSFVDPGADSWTVTVTWGDGSTSQQPLGAREFALSHVYTAAGTFTVSVTVADDDSSTATTHTVTVVQPAPGLDAALPLVDQLVAARKIPPAVGTLFKAQIIAAQKLIARGNQPAARTILQALVVQIDLLVRLRQVSAVDIAPLRSVLVQVIGGLRPS